VKLKNLNPVWDETLKLNMNYQHLQDNGNLLIECWDLDYLKKDDYMGQSLFNLKELKEGVKVHVIVKLEDVESGTLEMEITGKQLYVDNSSEFKESVKNRIKNPSEFALYKLQKSNAYKNQKQEHLAIFGNILTSPEKLKEKYLTIDWAATVDTQTFIRKTLSSVPDLDIDNYEKQLKNFNSFEENDIYSIDGMEKE
jgi:Ca2+-dependent lipid-binding protein